MSEKTIALSGAETEVHFSGGNAWLRNDGAAVVYASKTAGVAAGADGVISIPAGGSAPVYGANGTVFLLGSGSVQLVGSDYATNPFDTGSARGGTDVVSNAAGIVTLDGLQGGVPFSGITLSGDIVGQNITLTACGKNLIPYPYSRTSGIYNGITIDISDDGKFSVSGVATTSFTLITFANQDKPIKLAAGRAYTISCSQPYDFDNFNLYFRIYHIDGTYSGVNSYPTTFIAKDGDYIVGSLWVDDGISFNLSNVSIQIESGDTATDYEPYRGSTIAITPDSVPYTVTNDIRQQDGVNTVSVSAGEVKVTGVRRNAAVKRIWDKLDELTAALIVANGEV